VEAMVDHKSSSGKRSHGSRDNRFILISSINQASKTHYLNNKPAPLNDLHGVSVGSKN
jgi:hypothetical protein